MTCRSQRGVALVVTLIMLSVITVMTVAFLAITRRERASVTQTASATETRLMLETAVERAKATVLSQVMATTNFMEPDLLVSRNWIKTNGFDPGLAAFNPANPDLTLLTNVNYEYTLSGTRLNANEWIQNIANLYFDPRPPVFIRTNRIASEPLDFRFYLDLNRNLQFETNGTQPDLDNARALANPTNTYLFVGDPEWIGVLEQPYYPHSRSNRFLGRFAYLVQPVGKSLDVNFLHNHAKRMRSAATLAYSRNQGFGSWEINLAAFLAELNTNYWNPLNNPYFYNTNAGSPSSGAAFFDANEILRWRYGELTGNWTADSAQTMLPAAGRHPFETDYIDSYANGPMLLGAVLNTGQDDDLANEPWPGADSLNHFFSVHDFWFTNTMLRTFNTKLEQAGDRASTYDRYTFYRMLAQLGTDSAAESPIVNPRQLMQKLSARRPQDFPPEPVGKINLNYDNLTAPSTSFQPWTRAQFFTNIAGILIRAQFGGSDTNPFPPIQVYPTNFYSPAIHRILQVAANIYDATTPQFDPNVPESFPSVFRPIFKTTGNIIEIVGYYEDNNSDINNINAWIKANPHGIPFVIGAKKGLPNFNEYVIQTTALATRKLELYRPNTNSPPNRTNEMYILGVSNFCGVEFWNSYRQTNTYPTEIRVGNVTNYRITNSLGLLHEYNFAFGTNYNLSRWPGFDRPNDYYIGNTFQVPLSNTVTVLPNSVYRPERMPQPWDPVGTNFFTPNPGGGFIIPEWVLTISNQLTAVLSTGNKILDFVYLDKLTNTINITGELMGQGGGVSLPADETYVAQAFQTNRPSPADPPQGVLAQLNFSLTRGLLPASVWNTHGYDSQRATGDDVTKAIEAFQAFVYPTLVTNSVSNLVMQAPFSPTRKFVYTMNWQANDPLIHHLPDHLKDLTNNFSVLFIRPTNSIPTRNLELGRLNGRYAPWGGNPVKTQGTDPNYVNLAVKDPGVWRSDDWNFPTNKYPSIGWLGRVHRGTPWQTIYLKSQAAPFTDWVKQFLDVDAHPTNDWRLIDIFTVAPHPNASHGQLSVNQTNLAAWSAVLSGVTVQTNLDPIMGSLGNTNVFETLVIEPGSPQIQQIVGGINTVRTNVPGRTFRRVGDLLAVPELTVNSPYLNHLAAELPRAGIDDAAYERIPQQILSLLKVGDARYVIYAFGQSLRPAENSIVTSGPHIGICTNYQITGEAVARAVLRLDGSAIRPRPVIESYNLLPFD